MIAGPYVYPGPGFGVVGDYALYTSTTGPGGSSLVRRALLTGATDTVHNAYGFSLAPNGLVAYGGLDDRAYRHPFNGTPEDLGPGTGAVTDGESVAFIRGSEIILKNAAGTETVVASAPGQLAMRDGWVAY